MNIQRQTPSAFRTSAMAAGVLFLITHIGAVGASALYGPVLQNLGFTGGAVDDRLIVFGALLDVITALAVVGTSVALYPIVKRQNEGIALGYVGLRTVEAGIIAIGVIPLLVLVADRQLTSSVGAEYMALAPLGTVLVELHSMAYLVGPGLVCGVNTVLMAYLLYTSRLVPRFIPVLGLIGGPLIFVSSVFTMFGELPAWAGLAVLPIFAWELLLALWLIARGFNQRAVVSVSPAPEPVELLLAA